MNNGEKIEEQWNWNEHQHEINNMIQKHIWRNNPKQIQMIHMNPTN